MRSAAAPISFLPLDLRPGFSRRGTGAEPVPLINPNNFVTPVIGEDDNLQCQGTEFDQFSVQNWWEAFWRVLCYNPPQVGNREVVIKKRREKSLLGAFGHIERMNAWTHLVGVVGYLVFALLRGYFLDSKSLAGMLSSAAAFALCLTFLVSTTYHTLGAVRSMAPILRTFDHGSIQISLAITSVADAAVCTSNFKDVTWQTISDPLLVALTLLCFFLYRRIVLDPSFTEIAWGDCILGLFRIQHADFEHSALRSAGYVVIAFGFVMLIPVAYNNLDFEAFFTIVISNALGLFLLILGLLLDNVLLWPDVLYQEAARKRKKMPPWQTCHSAQCGCIMTSHAFWHVGALFSVVIATVGREVALASLQGSQL